jgi:hypothetical protein
MAAQMAAATDSSLQWFRLLPTAAAAAVAAGRQHQHLLAAGLGPGSAPRSPKTPLTHTSVSRPLSPAACACTPPAQYAPRLAGLCVEATCPVGTGGGAGMSGRVTQGIHNGRSPPRHGGVQSVHVADWEAGTEGPGEIRWQSSRFGCSTAGTVQPDTWRLHLVMYRQPERQCSVPPLVKGQGCVEGGGTHQWHTPRV